MADTPHQRAARKRWPDYTTNGTGQYAVVCPVVRIVHLYDLEMWGKVHAQDSHSNWECAGQHKLYVVTPDYQAAQILTRPAEIERD